MGGSSSRKNLQIDMQSEGCINFSNLIMKLLMGIFVMGCNSQVTKFISVFVRFVSQGPDIKLRLNKGSDKFRKWSNQYPIG